MLLIIGMLALTALTATLFLEGLLRTRLVVLFQDLPDARKVHKKVVPRFGGVAILTVFLVSAIVMAHIQFFPSLDWDKGMLLPTVVSALVFLFIGLLDDSHMVYFIRRFRDRRRGIAYTDPKGWHFRVRNKLMVEFALAAWVTWFTGYTFPGIAFLGPVAFPVTWVWLVGVANAFNIIDGLDGLCGGISLITMGVLAVLASVLGCFGTMWLAIAIAGTTAGFLILNTHPAKLFMGDMGSLFLGFVTALMSLRLSQAAPESFGMPAVLLVAGFPVLDVGTAMVRRWYSAPDGSTMRERLKKIVSADAQHIHHRFLSMGYNHLQVSLRLYLVAAVFLMGAVAVMIGTYVAVIGVVMASFAGFVLLRAYMPLHNRRLAFTFARIAGVLVVTGDDVTKNH